jgi:hypothetical protein
MEMVTPVEGTQYATMARERFKGLKEKVLPTWRETVLTLVLSYVNIYAHQAACVDMEPELTEALRDVDKYQALYRQVQTRDPEAALLRIEAGHPQEPIAEMTPVLPVPKAPSPVSLPILTSVVPEETTGGDVDALRSTNASVLAAINSTRVAVIYARRTTSDPIAQAGVTLQALYTQQVARDRERAQVEMRRYENASQISLLMAAHHSQHFEVDPLKRRLATIACYNSLSGIDDDASRAAMSELQHEMTEEDAQRTKIGQDPLPKD